MRRLSTIVSIMLCGVLLTVCMCGCTPGDKQVSKEESGTNIDSIMAEMSTRDKVEQMMLVSYRMWEETPETDSHELSETVENIETENKKVNVTELNDVIRDDLRNHHYGGVILFSENYKDAEQTCRLVSDMQSANQEGGGLPLLVATDQEGGSVSRITFGTTGVGNMALSATSDPANAEMLASIYGTELEMLGINTDFAPVLDINNNPRNPVIGVRSFGDDPEKVAEYGLSYMTGLHNTGTITTLKHFPGHGDTGTDSHTGFPCIQSSYEELKECELIPFRQAIDAGADMIMTAHIQYPQIEAETYQSISTGEKVYLPATMSHRILTDILRDDMGFEGVIVTDALHMDAIDEIFAMEDVLCMTINAGANFLMPRFVIGAEDIQNLSDMVDMTVSLAEEGEIEMDKIDDSVRRILTLKEKYGLLEERDFTVSDAQIKEAESVIGSTQSKNTTREIARKALTLVKNDEDAFPLDVQAGESTLILFADSCASRIGTANLARRELLEKGVLSEDQTINVMVNTTENEAECLDAANEADYVILVYRMYSTSCLDPETKDGFSSAVFDRIIDERHAAGKKVVLISCQLPYDAARFQKADAILLTYNSSAMADIPPVSGEGSAYAPNLLEGLCACFRGGEITGKLPVNIPKLDENYQFTEEILYPRQN